MPQPLSRFAPDAGIVIAPSGIIGNDFVPVFERNPRLGALAMEVIVAWSQVELAEYQTFADMAGGASSEGYENYVNLRTQGDKSSMFNRYAQKKLSSDHNRLLQALRALSKSYSGQRDRIAHWSWGWIIDRADVVLCVDPRVFVQAMGTSQYDHIYVYDERDFANLARDCYTLSQHYMFFSAMVGLPDAASQASIYAQLCSQPSIADRLSRPKD